MRKVGYLLILSSILLIFPFSAICQWSNDPNVNTIVATNAFDPKMVSDGAGGAIIVWWNGDDYGLHAQRLDKYGYARWGNNGVYLGGLGWYQTEYFSLCEDGNGGCVVAFDDIYTQSPTYYARIFAQRIDSLGNKLWGNIGSAVCHIDSIGVGGAHVVSDGLGGFFVTWSDRREWWLRVYGQHLDGNGNGTWIDNGICISDSTNFTNDYSALVPGGPGYCIAFWDDLVQTGDSRPISQRIDQYGSLLWGEGVIFPETMSYFGSRNKYAIDGCGGFIATGFNQLAVSGGAVSACTQRFGDSGVSIWTENGIQFCDSIGAWPSHIPAEFSINESGAFYAWVNGPPQ